MKGLPLAYSKDMQEDKEVAFDALGSLSLAVAAMTGMVGDLSVNREKMAAAAGAGFSTATDIADWLVRVANVPFRDAHHVTGRLVALAESRGIGLEGLTIDDFKSVDERIDSRIHRCSAPRTRCARAPATAAPRPITCASRPPAGRKLTGERPPEEGAHGHGGDGGSNRPMAPRPA